MRVIRSGLVPETPTEGASVASAPTTKSQILPQKSRNVTYCLGRSRGQHVVPFVGYIDSSGHLSIGLGRKGTVFGRSFI